jgi:hypothetical protein
MGPPSQIEPGSAIPMILPGTEALIRSLVIAERVRDGHHRGGPESDRCGDHGDGSAPSSTPLLLLSSKVRVQLLRGLRRPDLLLMPSIIR